ncbi:MAG TPA: Z1 domain-containing protein [Saprospiraceae bacterium]|mgnify:CR=1 FL=1|nr:Z1 domain-containing protein [Saprospiraceae bacterium]
MTNIERVEIIKTLIKEKVKEREHISHVFFDELIPEFLTLKNLLPGFSVLDEVTFLHLYRVAVKEYQSVFPIEIDPSMSLTKNGFQTWLTEERKQNLPYDYINRYLTYLAKRGRSEKVIDEIKDSSEKILSKIGDPRSEKPFYVKGLVVGSVQSGKTGNFNAVINRAIDSGYALIIILSGIMEDLRSQTQLRIEEDVIGEGTQDVTKDTKGDKGVGMVRRFGEQGDQSVRQVFSITSYKSDFKKSVKETDFSLNNKNILICKKNTGVLKNLLIWLSDYLNENKEKHNIPFLIVDDEADNASLNNLGKKGIDYASTINGHIRALLNLFTKKTYLGYTATPFANVLQDRNGPGTSSWMVQYKVNGELIAKDFGRVDNIFPDDFIELLSSPSNYIGAKQIFETILDDSLKIPLVEIISDASHEFPAKILKDDGSERATTRNDPFPVRLPASLEEATQCFILTIALRLSRVADMRDSGLMNPHHTMLVHISRFIPWQNRTKEMLKLYVDQLTTDINNDLPNNKNLIYGTLEKTWNRYYATIVQNIRSYLPEGYADEFLMPKAFAEIRAHLTDAVKGIEIKAVNSETGDKLQYVKDSFGSGKKIIAVGGNRLSRGFTLEGLTINYFIRNTNYSDTLLQMGRWFGYRPGYLDCCKIFTTLDAVEKFDSTTRTIEELEAEFIKMNRLHKTPQDFVLRVRKHAGTLKITRPSILKNTKVVNWSYQDQLVQSTRFKVNDPERLDAAWSAFRGFIKKYQSAIEYDSRFFRIDLSYNQLIEFLQMPNTFEDFEIPSIIKFIEICAEKNKLRKWTIAIKANGYGDDLEPDQTGLPSKIGLSIRTGPKPENTYFWEQFKTKGIFSASGKSANIVSSGSDFDLLLSEEQRKSAKKAFHEERSEYYQDKGITDYAKKAVEVTVPERVYREIMSDDHGLLVVYLMDMKSVYRITEKDQEMEKLFSDNNLNPNIPLIGYAIGFPPISPDPGGEYVHGDYDLDDDVSDDEWDPNLETTED